MKKFTSSPRRPSGIDYKKRKKKKKKEAVSIVQCNYVATVFLEKSFQVSKRRNAIGDREQ
jgi:hypothetical protein